MIDLPQLIVEQPFHKFRKAIANQEFLITAEVSPPKGSDPTHMLAQTRSLKGRVHAVNITDSSRAVMSMSPVAASFLIQQQIGIETVCQIAVHKECLRRETVT